MVERPTVAHVKRTYLSQTETFIANQIWSLAHYRSIVLCRHRVFRKNWAQSDVFAATELLQGRDRLLDTVAYRLQRRLSPAATAVLVDAARAASTRILHFHYLVDARFFLSLKRRLGLPAVASAYGYDVSAFPRLLGGVGRRYLAPIWQEIDLFIAMSADMKRDLVALGCPEDRIVIHFYGTPTARFALSQRTYAAPEVVEILSCGSLEVKKAQHLVLEALYRLLERDPAVPPFHLTLVGDGPLRSKLERWVRQHGWENRVTLAGHIAHQDPRLVAAYHRADIFTLPSMTVGGDKEGIPTALAEAMAAGLPCLTTRHAGIPELVEHEREGLLVAEDDVEALAVGFSRLLRDPTLRARLGRSGAVKAASVCDLASRTANLERIYAAALDGRDLARSVRQAPEALCAG